MNSIPTSTFKIQEIVGYCHHALVDMLAKTLWFNHILRFYRWYHKIKVLNHMNGRYNSSTHMSVPVIQSWAVRHPFSYFSTWLAASLQISAACLIVLISSDLWAVISSCLSVSQREVVLSVTDFCNVSVSVVIVDSRELDSSLSARRRRCFAWSW